ncbi:GDSL-type esterase/lipase family protein [Helicobacter sp. 23-1044]
MKSLLVICLIILGGFFIFNHNSANRRICPLQGDSIITIGDSLANGYGVSENESFAIQTAQILQKRAIKLGINGETSSELLGRIDGELAGKNPAAIIISIGGNDFLRKFDKSATAQNIRAITQKAKAKTPCVVLLGVPDGLLGLVGGVSNIYTDIAEGEGVLLETSAMPKILRQSTLKIDEIHPNKDGHTLIAKSLATLINSAK